MSIRVTTLGAVQVVHGDENLKSLPAQRLRCAILIYMAVTRESSRDRLLALFWPDRTEERARHALSQNIYELRRVLGEDWIEVQGERLVVSTRVSVDLAAFDEAVERGDWAAAVSLYRGMFLDGFYPPSSQAFESWSDNHRLRAQRQHRRARREWISQLLDQARVREAVAAARDWVALDGEDDEGQHRLIELLAESGDRAGAIRQYEAYARLLEADDLQPLPDTVALVDRIRDGEVGALPASPGVRGAPPPPPRRAAPAAEPVARQPEPAEGVAGVAPTTSDGAASGFNRRTFQWSAVVAALLIFAVAGGIWYARGRPIAPVIMAAPAPHRIAVLYLEDHSPPPGSPHLATGLTESLIDAFSRNGGLLVVRSKYAVAPFRDRAVTPDSLARALDIEMLLTGWLLNSAGRVRVTMQLVDPATAAVVDTRAVERAETEPLQLLDDLVDSVTWMLRGRLGAALDAVRRREETTEEAWTAVQKALVLMSRAPELARHDRAASARLLAEADSLLEHAERLDRTWAEPIVQRGWLAERRAYALIHTQDPAAGRMLLDSALAHADRALERRPGWPSAHELRGSIHFRRATFGAADASESARLMELAVADLQAAIEADPGRAQAAALLASAYFSQARFTQAAAMARQARQLDNFLRGARDNLYTLAMAEFEDGNDDEAARVCEEGRRRYPDHNEFKYCQLHIMAWSDAIPPRPDQAWQILATVPDADSATRPMLEMLVAATLLRANERDSALRVLDRAAAQPSGSEATEWIEAVVRGRAGQSERAMAMLQRHFSSLNTPGLPVRQGRALRPLLTDPAFSAGVGTADRER